MAEANETANRVVLEKATIEIFKSSKILSGAEDFAYLKIQLRKKERRFILNSLKSIRVNI